MSSFNRCSFSFADNATRQKNNGIDSNYGSFVELRMNPAFHQPVVCVALGLILIITSLVLLIVFSINDNFAEENGKTRDISVTLTCILGSFRDHAHTKPFFSRYLFDIIIPDIKLNALIRSFQLKVRIIEHFPFSFQAFICNVYFRSVFDIDWLLCLLLEKRKN